MATLPRDTHSTSVWVQRQRRVLGVPPEYPPSTRSDSLFAVMASTGTGNPAGLPAPELVLALSPPRKLVITAGVKMCIRFAVYFEINLGEWERDGFKRKASRHNADIGRVPNPDPKSQLRRFPP